MTKFVTVYTVESLPRARMYQFTQYGRDEIINLALRISDVPKVSQSSLPVESRSDGTIGIEV